MQKEKRRSESREARGHRGERGRGGTSRADADDCTGTWFCVCARVLVCVSVVHCKTTRLRGDETMGCTVSGRLRWHLLLGQMSAQYVTHSDTHTHTHYDTPSL